MVGVVLVGVLLAVAGVRCWRAAPGAVASPDAPVSTRPPAGPPPEFPGTRPATPLIAAPAPAPGPAGIGSAQDEAGLPVVPSGDFELVLTDDEVAALVEARYQRLWPVLALPPGLEERLRARLADRQAAVMDIANAAFLMGLNPARDVETIRAAVAAAEAESDQAIAAEFGAPVAAAIARHERTLADHNAVAIWAQALASAGVPLQSGQQARLLAALERAGPPGSPPDLRTLLFGATRRARPLDGAARAALEQELTSEQAAALPALAGR